MEFRNVTKPMLEYALSEVNRHYNGNVRFKRIDFKRHTKQGGEVWQVTLTVKSKAERIQCDECGERRGHPNHRTKAQCKAECDGHYDPAVESPEPDHTWNDAHHRYRAGVDTKGVVLKLGERYISAACWHVHGVFFDALPVRYMGRKVSFLAGGSLPGSYSGRSSARWTPADDWRNNPKRDWNAGPVMASEQCDCNSDYSCSSKSAVRPFAPTDVDLVDYELSKELK